MTVYPLAAPVDGSGSAEIDLAAVLERRARVSPERPAVTFRGETRTYAQVQDRVRRLARVLRSGGVGPGDRVAYLGLNDPAILETLFAVANLGAVLVPLTRHRRGLPRRVAAHRRRRPDRPRRCRLRL